MKWLLALIFVSIIITNCHAQTDTEFWFVAPSISQCGFNCDVPIEFNLTTSNQAANVTISQPAGGGMPTQTISIPANSTVAVDVTVHLSSLENSPANSILNKGVKIVSNVPIAAFYEVVSGLNNGLYQNNEEAFVLKGAISLGTNFMIPGQNIAGNSTNLLPLGYNQVNIVATENNTNVTIRPSKNIVGHLAGVPFTIVLNTGQTYSAQASSQAASQHLEGSTVTSDKPIAITLSDDLLDSQPYYTSGWGRDLIGDQIVPVNMLGTQYIAIKGELTSPGDQLFITAIQNNTTISKNGTIIATINSGQTYQTNFNTTAVSINTNNPVSVWQLSGIGAEFGGTLLPKLDCTGSASVSYPRSTNESLYVYLVTRTGNEGNFTVNGSATVFTSADFFAVPGTAGQWLYAKKQLPLSTYPQNQVIKVTNTSGLFHMSVLDGFDGHGTSYGYFSDYGSGSVVTASSSGHCIGNDLHLSATGGNSPYLWTGPNGFTSNLQNPIINNVTTANSGTYVIVSSNACGVVSDTVNVTISAPPPVNLGQDTFMCSNDYIALTAGPASGFGYNWNTGSTQNTLNVNQAGIYIVTVTDQISGCYNSDTINVEIAELNSLSLGNDTIICNQNGFTLSPLLPLPGDADVLWSTGATSSSITVTQSGTYWVQVNYASGCVSTDSVTILMNVSVPIFAFPSDTVICQNETLQLYATGGATYSWEPSLYLNNSVIANPIATPTQSIEYIVTGIDVNGCYGSDTIEIAVNPTPEVLINGSGDIYDCSGESKVTLTASGASKYIWSPSVFVDDENGNVVNATPSYSSYILVRGETPEGCHNYDSFFVNVQGSGRIFIANAFSPNNDGVNDIYKIVYHCNFELTIFRIFNRWGQLVFSTNNIQEGWNGYYKSGKADLGNYFYYIEGKTPEGTIRKYKGDVLLMR